MCVHVLKVFTVLLHYEIYYITRSFIRCARYDEIVGVLLLLKARKVNNKNALRMVLCVYLLLCCCCGVPA
jgi:hypothetical protein